RDKRRRRKNDRRRQDQYLTLRTSWMRLPLASSRLYRLMLLGAALFVTSCRPVGVLDPQGPIAAAERLVLINSLAIMLVVEVPVIVTTLAFAWWYRASNPRAVRSLDVAYE